MEKIRKIFNFFYFFAHGRQKIFDKKKDVFLKKNEFLKERRGADK